MPIAAPWLAERPPPEPAVRATEESPADSRSTRWRALLADRLPLAVRGGRLALDRRAVLALGLIVLAGVLLGCFTWWRSRPAEDSITARAEAAGQPVEADGGEHAHRRGRRAHRTDAASDLPSASATAALVVDVEGRVRRPGVLTLPAGARVADALREAGGAAPGVDAGGLNLARLLADGEQLLVGVPGAAAAQPGGPAGAAGPDGMVDLNVATAAQLQTLPGIGPVLAQHVLDWRGAHGRFTSVDQLREVGGIGPRKLARLRGKVRL